jgi:TrkA domain protein
MIDMAVEAPYAVFIWQARLQSGLSRHSWDNSEQVRIISRQTAVKVPTETIPFFGGLFYMATVSEAYLPGVGRKFQIETLRGERLVIVIHDDGVREIYHFSRKNLDRAESVITLTDGEARQMAGIVGGLTYVPKALPTSEIVLDDLVLDWFTIEPGAAAIGRSIRDLQARTVTGASIVSLIEADRSTRTNPEADTILNEGATLILAGDRQTIAALKRLLVNGKV